MAKAEKTLERVYNIPLRKEYLKVPYWKRTKKAVVATRQFLQKHLKAKEVKLGTKLNEVLWEKGIKNPPHHIKVTVVKDEKGIVKAELFGYVPKVKEKSIKPAKAITEKTLSEKVAEPEKKEEKK